MTAETDLPVTVKSRIGIDDRDDYAFLCDFVDALATAGCRKFVVHARIAILDGLSPKENRTIPPLCYERVYRLKRDYPELCIVINGGLDSLDAVVHALSRVDGAMIGRQAYHRPYFLAELEQHLRPGWQKPARDDVVLAMQPYVDRVLADGERLNRVTRHMLGLYAGQPGARRWRRYLSEHAHKEGAGSEVLVNALNAMPRAAMTATMQR